MRSAAAWLARLWGWRAADVAAAYRQQLDPDGTRSRLVLADLAQVCMAGETSVVPGDPQGTAFNEGKRAIWLHIQSMLRLDPSEIPNPEDKR